jgi:hypothetical protein
MVLFQTATWTNSFNYRKVTEILTTFFKIISKLIVVYTTRRNTYQPRNDSENVEFAANYTKKKFKRRTQINSWCRFSISEFNDALITDTATNSTRTIRYYIIIQSQNRNLLQLDYVLWSIQVWSWMWRFLRIAYRLQSW